MAPKWKTTGLQQANTMGGGEAAIPKNGTFRVFVMMGQSNMTGAARANELRLRDDLTLLGVSDEEGGKPRAMSERVLER